MPDEHLQAKLNNARITGKQFKNHLYQAGPEREYNPEFVKLRHSQDVCYIRLEIIHPSLDSAVPINFPPSKNGKVEIPLGFAVKGEGAHFYKLRVYDKKGKMMDSRMGHFIIDPDWAPHHEAAPITVPELAQPLAADFVRIEELAERY